MSRFSRYTGHPILGRGDLVDAIGDGDNDVVRAVAEQLGLEYRFAVPPPSEQLVAAQRPSIAVPKIDSSGYPSYEYVEDVALWLLTKYAAVAPLPEIPSGPAYIEWKDQKNHPLNEPTQRPLAPWSYVGPILRRDLTVLNRTNRLDIPKLVKQFAERKIISVLPRKKKRRWGLRFQIINDISLRLSTFQSDQQTVIDELARLIPQESLEIAVGTSPFHLRVSNDAGGREPPYRVPAPGSHVLVLGDLGGLARSVDEWRVWMRWGRMITGRGCHLQALIPCAVSRIPPPLRQVYSIETWQKSVQTRIDVAQRAELVRQLLVLASPAIRIEPGLLRDLRQLIPAATDAALEADFWNHEWLSSNHHAAATIDCRKVNEVLRPQFERLDPALRKKAVNCIRHWRVHIQGAPEIWFEEFINLSPSSRAQLPDQDLKDAYACIRKIDLRRNEVSSAQSSYDAYMNRLTQRVGDSALSDPTVGRILRNAKRELHPNVYGVAAGTDPREIPAGTLRHYQVSVFDNEVVVAPQEDGQRGSALAPREFAVRSSNQHFTLETVGATSEALFSISGFWKSGQKPNCVADFGTDQYGAWFEFQIPHSQNESGLVTQRMRWIPAGSCLMGSPEDEVGRFGDEGPQHRVTLTKGFWLADTPCTQEMWEAITGKNPSEFKGAQLPVETVSWDDAQEFIQTVSRQFPGLELHLPSEAQWEYACRAGSKTRYCYGDELTAELANFNRNVGQTTEVKSYPCNKWGLYDVHGNVDEWCRDGNRKYETGDVVDPLGSDDGSRRVIRGGSWFNYAQRARSAYRFWRDPGGRVSYLGFRCLSSVAEPSELAEVPVAEQGSQPTRVGGAGKNFATRAIKVSSHDVTKIQTGGAASKLAISTDLEELHFNRLTRPPWATAFGRDAYGVFADFEITAINDPAAKVGQRLRWIPPGRFAMGSPANEPGRSENEVLHDVIITSGFWMFETSCRQQLWLAVMGGENPSRFPDPERPVERVSWDDAKEFTKRISDRFRNQSSELDFRLPTEAEWEYACRAGTKTAIYSGSLKILGDANALDLDPIAWYRGNSGHEFDHDQPENLAVFGKEQRQYEFTAAGTRRVKQKRPNPWGLYDMLGNVWEWCQDWHADYDLNSLVDPVGPEEGSYRVLRGGSWVGRARYARSAFRSWVGPGGQDVGLGFRCLSSVSQQAERESASTSEPRDEAAEKRRTK